MANTRYSTVEFKRLIQIQNAIAFSKAGQQDIITITGFMNDAEFVAHVARYEASHGHLVEV